MENDWKKTSKVNLQAGDNEEDLVRLEFFEGTPPPEFGEIILLEGMTATVGGKEVEPSKVVDELKKKESRLDGTGRRSKGQLAEKEVGFRLKIG
jgi:hypothetical protein